jgi:hypothetical protein
MQFKEWLLNEEISPITVLQYAKEINPNTHLKNPMEKILNLSTKERQAEAQRRSKEILDYYQNLPEEEKQKIENWSQEQKQKAIKKQEEEWKNRYLSNHPHMSEDDYNKLYSQGTSLPPEQQYQARKYQRNKWLEKTNRDEWNNLTIVHWLPGMEDRKYKEATRMLTGQIPPYTELSATYYPKDFNMSNVGNNRWGDFAVQLQGEVVSGHSADAASDDRWHPDGRQAKLGDFGTPEAPVEKFGGKRYTLKPAFNTEHGWNELIIRNWKIVAFLMYKNNKNGYPKTPNEIQEDQKIMELAKSKGIPVKMID